MRWSSQGAARSGPGARIFSRLTRKSKHRWPRRWRTLTLLRLPAALPYFLGGLRIGCGLALVGAIAAELAAGAAGQGGARLPNRRGGLPLNIPRMFVALTLVSLAGVAIYAGLEALSAFLLDRSGR